MRITETFSISNLKRHHLTLLAAGGVFLIFGLVIPNSTMALTVIPPRIELDGDPGTTVSSKFEVLNETAETITYYTQVENFEAKDETGTPQFIQSQEGLAVWVDVANSVRVEPGEKKAVPYIVKIPRNAEPGGYFASIFIRTTPPSERGGEVSIGARLGTLVLLRVNGNIQEGVDILEFTSKDKQRIFTSLPVELYYRFQNTGSDRVKPTGEVIIKNLIGMKAKVLSANRTEGSVLPRSIRRFEMAWIHGGGGSEETLAQIEQRMPSGFFSAAKYQLSNFAMGYYTAHLDIAYGVNNNTAKGTFRFLVIPWQLLIIIFVILIITLVMLRFILKRYNRYIISKHNR